MSEYKPPVRVQLGSQRPDDAPLVTTTQASKRARPDDGPYAVWSWKIEPAAVRTFWTWDAAMDFAHQVACSNTNHIHYW